MSGKEKGAKKARLGGRSFRRTCRASKHNRNRGLKKSSAGEELEKKNPRATKGSDTTAQTPPYPQAYEEDGGWLLARGKYAAMRKCRYDWH